MSNSMDLNLTDTKKERKGELYENGTGKNIIGYSKLKSTL